MTTVGGTVRRARGSPESIDHPFAGAWPDMRRWLTGLAASTVETLRGGGSDLGRSGPKEGTQEAASPATVCTSGEPAAARCRADWRRPDAYWQCTKAAGHRGRHRLRRSSPLRRPGNR